MKQQSINTVRRFNEKQRYNFDINFYEAKNGDVIAQIYDRFYVRERQDREEDIDGFGGGRSFEKVQGDVNLNEESFDKVEITLDQLATYCEKMDFEPGHEFRTAGELATERLK